jgi:hypothetical protein
MSERLGQSTPSASRRCLVCSEPLIEGKAFCPSCGAKAIPSSTLSAIDVYVQKKIDLELSTRLRDTNSIVRELGDRAEGVVWKRLRLAGLFLLLISGGITFLGVNTYLGVSRNIERIAAAAEQRVQEKVDAIKASLDTLSGDVDAQTRRVAQKGDEISQNLQNLDATATALSARLDAIVKSLETKVAQITTQVDDISARQAYPTLGQKEFVTLQGKQWTDTDKKSPNEKWIDIIISSTYLPDLTSSQVDLITSALRKSG